jgi:hypothetical protein
MAYSDFTLERVENELGVILEASAICLQTLHQSHPQPGSFKPSIG